ncbi:hypothetical protein [Enterococcus cecorum]|uniref:hypothetical protein n=1 Tax=Enterococcus cecorum TaxID=44008 RepID=UPI001FADB825|nr:hypothetical protein [Enterococcus cecorum]MCJ0537926.1 hypothetical protein [Enterococcus cecorum]MCJ0545622.1 hypothetical protein [Enterococcus cecorum]MCJ0551982.1 hypothetical protein [Enterococcus cecorum]MCJ0568624.1 hypothetical protein [Enterococcus cecorum]
MKYKKLLKHKHIFLFLFVFYLLMGVSKYAFVLFAQEHQSLDNYSLSYSAMAISGALSFMITNQIPKNKTVVYFRIFVPLYTLGMFLRIFVENRGLAILSGVIGGLGASAILLLVRHWFLHIGDQDKENSNLIRSSRFTISNIASIIAVPVSGCAIFLMSFYQTNAYVTLLVIYACLMLLLSFTKVPNIEIPEKKQQWIFLPQYKARGSLLYIITFILGICGSMITSILPAIIKGAGWSVMGTTYLTTLIAVLTLLLTLILSNNWVSKKLSLFFFLNQFIGILVALIIPLIVNSKMSMLIVLFVVEMTLAGYFVISDLMDYQVIPKVESTIYLGILQSSFLVGDSVGSPLGSFLYDRCGLSILFMSYALICCVGTISFLAYYHKYKEIG